MSIQVTTTIKSQSITEGKNRLTGSAFKKWNIQAVDGAEYSKIVPDTFLSPFGDSAPVLIIYNQNGQFRNIVEIQPVRMCSDASNLSMEAVETSLAESATRVAGRTKTAPQSSNSGSRYDSKGARDGMVTGRTIELVRAATQLAIARGDMTPEGLMVAADELVETALYVAGRVSDLAKQVESHQ